MKIVDVPRENSTSEYPESNELRELFKKSLLENQQGVSGMPSEEAVQDSFNTTIQSQQSTQEQGSSSVQPLPPAQNPHALGNLSISETIVLANDYRAQLLGKLVRLQGTSMLFQVGLGPNSQEPNRFWLFYNGMATAEIIFEKSAFVVYQDGVPIGTIGDSNISGDPHLLFIPLPPVQPVSNTALETTTASVKSSKKPKVSITLPTGNANEVVDITRQLMETSASLPQPYDIEVKVPKEMLSQAQTSSTILPVIDLDPDKDVEPIQ